MSLQCISVWLAVWGLVAVESRLLTEPPASSRTSTGPRAMPPPTGYVSITDFPAGAPEETVREATTVELPGLSNEHTYSGFITVNRTSAANLFFWFFESPHAGPKAPIILWLEGGPGCSSMMETITVGPLLINPDLSLAPAGNPFTWNANYSILFIDNPVGVGFSFVLDAVNGYVTNEPQLADQLFEALQQFFTRFASYASNDFFVFGISYAGKYVPSLGVRILVGNDEVQNNSSHTSGVTINLKGLGIGSGLVDPIIQTQHYAEIASSSGLVDVAQKGEMQASQAATANAILQQNWTAATAGWNDILGQVVNASGGVNLYDLRSYDPNLYNFPHTADFFAQERVRAALHVGTRAFCPDCPDFIPGCDPSAYNALQPDMMQSVRGAVQQLIERVPLLFYSGQFDVIVGVPVATSWLDALVWSGQKGWAAAPRTVLTYNSTPAAYSRCVNVVVVVAVVVVVVVLVLFRSEVSFCDSSCHYAVHMLVLLLFCFLLPSHWRIYFYFFGHRTYKSLTQVVVRDAGHITEWHAPGMLLQIVTSFIESTR
jgi:carboxypeptidase C (cathepsin A)